MFRRSSTNFGPISLTNSITQPSSISEDQLQMIASGYRQELQYLSDSHFSLIILDQISYVKMMYWINIKFIKINF